MPTQRATNRLVTVKVPGSAHNHHLRDRTAGWLTASFTLDARRNQRVERGGELRRLDVADDDDFLIIGFREACASAEAPFPDALRCRVVSTIAIAAGQGASAAAVVAGILGARALLELSLDDAMVSRIACAIDASPDQIHAAIDGHSMAAHITCNDD